MFSYEDILNYYVRYKIENGNVIDRNTIQKVIDENVALKVKAAMLIFKESNTEDYIKKTMEKYDENSLVNAILNSNGHYEEIMFGNDLQNSKFSILVPPKYEYGISYLKLKFREKGLDIENFKINIIQSPEKNSEQYKVIINFQIKKYENQNMHEKSNQATIQYITAQDINQVLENMPKILKQSTIQHPKIQELNELDEQIRLAKINNDEVGYRNAKILKEKIISETRMKVSSEQWDSMSIQDKMAFVKIKMDEAKILRAYDECNYWSSYLIRLNKMLSSQPKVSEYQDNSNNELSNKQVR